MGGYRGKARTQRGETIRTTAIAAASALTLSCGTQGDSKNQGGEGVRGEGGGGRKREGGKGEGWAGEWGVNQTCIFDGVRVSLPFGLDASPTFFLSSAVHSSLPPPSPLSSAVRSPLSVIAVHELPLPPLGRFTFSVHILPTSIPRSPSSGRPVGCSAFASSFTPAPSSRDRSSPKKEFAREGGERDEGRERSSLKKSFGCNSNTWDEATPLSGAPPSERPAPHSEEHALSAASTSWSSPSCGAAASDRSHVPLPVTAPGLIFACSVCCLGSAFPAALPASGCVGHA